LLRKKHRKSSGRNETNKKRMFSKMRNKKKKMFLKMRNKEKRLFSKKERERMRKEVAIKDAKDLRQTLPMSDEK